MLRDGGTAHLRPIRPDDAAALQAFHLGQSTRSTYFRFFAPLERLPDAELERFTNVDHTDRVALVAIAEEDDAERIIAVGRFDRTAATAAEVAFNVADRHHGRGLGSALLEHLAAAARELGIDRFTAEVLPSNTKMLAVFAEAGYVVEQRLDDGYVWVTVDIDPTEQSVAVRTDREHRAEARSMHGLITPGSVLVISEGPAGAEHDLAVAVTEHLVAAPGSAHPVVHVLGWAGVAGTQVWADLVAVPGPVDLLILAVAAARSAQVVRGCARLRPRGVVVLSGGFAETGPEGLAHQRDLLHAAHAAGMRVLGPASYGLLRHGAGEYPTVNASLAAQPPPPGRLGLFCQSAPMAVGLLASAARRSLGVSTLISAGNRADVSGNDAMQLWTRDAETDVVALYLESIGNPRKFARIARRLAGVKPLVVLTAGQTGHVVPAGHVVRRTQVPRHALEEMLRQSGAIRVTSQHQLLDVAQLLVHQPVPVGPRVAVVASSEPLAALVAEAAESAGLVVTARRAILGGPPGPESLDRLAADLEAAYADPGCDGVVVVHVPSLDEPDPAVARAVAVAAARSERSTVACILGLSGITAELTAPDADGRPRTVPAYAAPEDGVLALAAAVSYGQWRATDRGRRLEPSGLDRHLARGIIDAVLAAASDEDPPVPLDAGTITRLLACYGIPVPDPTPDCPPDTRAGDTTCCVITSSEDPRFGPVVSFGLVGDAELFGDASFGVAPLTDVDVAEMIRSVRAAPRILGRPGEPALDVAALEDVLGRVSVMADDLPELHHLELRPIVVRGTGVAVGSARVELARAGRVDGDRRMLPQ